MLTITEVLKNARLALDPGLGSTGSIALEIIERVLAPAGEVEVEAINRGICRNATPSVLGGAVAAAQTRVARALAFPGK